MTSVKYTKCQTDTLKTSDSLIKINLISILILFLMNYKMLETLYKYRYLQKQMYI